MMFFESNERKLIRQVESFFRRLLSLLKSHHQRFGDEIKHLPDYIKRLQHVSCKSYNRCENMWKRYFLGSFADGQNRNVCCDLSECIWLSIYLFFCAFFDIVVPTPLLCLFLEPMFHIVSSLELNGFLELAYGAVRIRIAFCAFALEAVRSR